MPSLFMMEESIFKMAVLMVRGGGSTVRPMLMPLDRFAGSTVICFLTPSCFCVSKSTTVLTLRSKRTLRKSIGLKSLIYLCLISILRGVRCSKNTRNCNENINSSRASQIIPKLKILYIYTHIYSVYTSMYTHIYIFTSIPHLALHRLKLICLFVVLCNSNSISVISWR